MNVWVTIYAIGAAEAVLLALALWWRTSNPQANRILAVWLGIVGVDLTVKAFYLASPGPAPDLLRASRFVALFPFLYGSLFYLYVRALTMARGFALRDVKHLAGFLLMCALTASWLLTGPKHIGGEFTFWFTSRPPPYWWYNASLFIYSLSYVIAALVSIQRYRRVLLQRRSDADRMSLRWLFTLGIGQIIIWCIATAQVLVRIPFVDYYLIYGAVAAWVCVVGWFSLGQPPVVDESLEHVSAASVDGTRDGSGESSGEGDALDDDARFPAVEVRLSQLMTRDALYREPALTIGQVAKRSGYPEYLVSAVINRRLGGNFWDYINRHRIDAARTCFADRDDVRTILEIAYACGFTSKSTFNAAFKRQAGQTPSAYREQHAGRSPPA
ncbi:AraC family transcriptional regulator [Thermomonas sp.]|uniref:helix-turn-helix domain-containing protein n=1 Tax=Thermomonas sp. TaxID=1971895 RepID=UPI0024874499|nr:AraC family transcriptional regulator [Thermomonas sp.]MDI1253619.1 AraC family transcriptional regulator [Thermomonas sp.]